MLARSAARAWLSFRREKVPGNAREKRSKNHVQERASEPGDRIALPESAPHTIVRSQQSACADAFTTEQ